MANGKLEGIAVRGRGGSLSTCGRKAWIPGLVLGLLGLLVALPPAHADAASSARYQACKAAYEESPATGYCTWEWTKQDGHDGTGITCEVYVKCTKCREWSQNMPTTDECVGMSGSNNPNCTRKAQGWYRGYEKNMKKVRPWCQITPSGERSVTDVHLKPD